MYGKLFDQMYDGTLGTRGPWQALVTFQQMIIIADKNGVVDMTPEALSRRTTIPLDIIKVGLEALAQPDAESRTPDEDGRRIVPLDAHRSWGWRIVNHAKYRAIRSAEERREYQRTYWHKRKDSTQLNNSTETQQTRPIAVSSKQEAVTTSADREGSRTLASPRASRSARAVSPSPEFDTFWAAYPRKEAKQDALRAWHKQVTGKCNVDRLMAALQAAKRTAQWSRDGGQYVPHAASWLNGRRWEDEPLTAEPAGEFEGAV